MTYELADAPTKTAKEPMAYPIRAVGYFDGVKARHSAKYSTEEIASFLRRESGSHDSYTIGFCEGLRK